MGAFAAAAGGIIGSLIGGAYNAKAVKDTNKTNLQIAQMNNEFNEEMMMRQMDYNTDMWNAQNAYNTPEQQRARLEEAGLNPYMMLDGGNAGTASSANSVTPASAQGVTMQAPTFDTQSLTASIGHLADMLFNKPVRDANVANTQMDTQVKNATLPLTLSTMEQALAGIGLDNKQKQRSLDLFNATFDNQVKQWDLQNQLLEKEREIKLAQINSVNLDNETKKIMNEYLPGFQQVQLQIEGQRLANLVEEGKLTKAEAIMKLTQSKLFEVETDNARKQGTLLEQEANRGHVQYRQMQLDYGVKLSIAKGIIGSTNAKNTYDANYWRSRHPTWTSFREEVGDPLLKYWTDREKTAVHAIGGMIK